jgi:double-stranded uracil-DNA glycosylase
MTATSRSGPGGPDPARHGRPRKGSPQATDRPGHDELLESSEARVPDVLRDGLDLLLVGINPGLRSAREGLHFAHPGNRLWATLAEAGLTPRRLAPDETEALLDAGVGITNLVARATARADEVTPDELVAGRHRLARLVEERQPRRVAVLGLGAYRTAFDQPGATVGRQPGTLGGRPLWLLPNTSGLNAAWQRPRLVAAFRAVHDDES